MRIEIDLSGLKKAHWYEYLIRFIFGGAVTAAAGALGHRFGPLFGGLFLAFPALLPASLTLVKEHDGRSQASDDAAGAACGAIGLFAFAFVVWTGSPRLNIALVLLVAAVSWFSLSYLCWRILDACRR